MTAPTPLLILGARSFAPEVAELAADTGAFRVAAFVENLDRERCPGAIDGIPVVWVGEIRDLAETHRAVCALGSTKRRGLIETAAAEGLRFATIVHPSARISRSSSIDEGSVVSVGVVVAAHSRIGRHVILNRGVLVGHHTEIGDYTSIQPGANIAGSCRIGEEVYVGMGAIVLDHVTVGARSVVGAGAVVVQDVPERVQVVGVPARIVKEGIDGL